jgi:hypothetical protein
LRSGEFAATMPRMGFRFRRSIRLAAGLRINLSKTGSSLSVGRRGATLNFRERGARATVGLPGTGLSYSTMLKSGPPTGLTRSASSAVRAWIMPMVVLAVLAVFLLVAIHG